MSAGLPYFDILLAGLEQGKPGVTAVFGAHVHWGYWGPGDRVDDSIAGFAEAAERMSGTVADAASIKLPKRIPYHVAMDLLLTGRWFDAEEALRHGVVSRIVAPDELDATVREMAEQIARTPKVTVKLYREVVRHLSLPDLRASMADEKRAPYRVLWKDACARLEKLAADAARRLPGAGAPAPTRAGGVLSPVESDTGLTWQHVADGTTSA